MSNTKKTFFTSDTHFSHANIIRYANRPFETTDAMDEALIENWNQVVGVDDEVYHLGDFAFCSGEKAQAIFDHLNGRKHLILGNHDKNVRDIQGWVWVKHYHELYVGKQMIVLFHYAQRVWNRSHHGAWHLYGHSHGSLPDDVKTLSFDVGVDCTGYRPISFEEVVERMRTRKWSPTDHHR